MFLFESEIHDECPKKNAENSERDYLDNCILVVVVPHSYLFKSLYVQSEYRFALIVSVSSHKITNVSICIWNICWMC